MFSTERSEVLSLLLHRRAHERETEMEGLVSQRAKLSRKKNDQTYLSASILLGINEDIIVLFLPDLTEDKE